ncbi:MAG: hypothetical protein KDD51_01820 [Bdellovibrionales bacterium]|nr:hypothetical protein [Bdellovibrionales bacterium]
MRRYHSTLCSFLVYLLLASVARANSICGEYFSAIVDSPHLSDVARTEYRNAQTFWNARGKSLTLDNAVEMMAQTPSLRSPEAKLALLEVLLRERGLLAEVPPEQAAVQRYWLRQRLRFVSDGDAPISKHDLARELLELTEGLAVAQSAWVTRYSGVRTGVASYSDRILEAMSRADRLVYGLVQTLAEKDGINLLESLADQPRAPRPWRDRAMAWVPFWSIVSAHRFNRLDYGRCDLTSQGVLPYLEAAYRPSLRRQLAWMHARRGVGVAAAGLTLAVAGLSYAAFSDAEVEMRARIEANQPAADRARAAVPAQQEFANSIRYLNTLDDGDYRILHDRLEPLKRAWQLEPGDELRMGLEQQMVRIVEEFKKERANE